MVDKICIFGGTGFVGTALCHEARGRGLDVRQLRTSDWWRREEMDLRDPVGLQVAFGDSVKDAHVIIAAAAGVGQVRLAPDEIGFNEFGRPRLAQMCENFGARSITMLGSFFEDILSEIKGSTRRSDSSQKIAVYGRSLKQGRQLFLDNSFTCMRQYVRLPQIYGANENLRRLFPSLVKGALLGKPCALRNPELVRDWCLVTDVANVLLEVRKVAGKFEDLTVLSGVERSVSDFAKLVERAVAEWQAIGDDCRGQDSRMNADWRGTFDTNLSELFVPPVSIGKLTRTVDEFVQLHPEWLAR